LGMALGRRRPKQASFWVEASRLEVRGRHPFYRRLNEILDQIGFDRYVEQLCRKYYAEKMGRPSIPPGVYFRCFLVSYFEGIGSDRGVAYRVSDSLSLRQFLGLSWEEATPDHSTLSKTRRRLGLAVHGAVFRWVLKALAREGLLEGKNLGVDATTLEANAAMRSIVRRDTGASYEEHVRELMENEEGEEPTAAERRRWDRKRKKRVSNREWVNRHDEEARIARMKDGRTRMAYKAEHAVDLKTGAVVAVTVERADRGDTETMRATLGEAGLAVTELAGERARRGAAGPVKKVSETGVKRVAADKGYHSRESLVALAEVGVKTVIAEPERGRQKWRGKQKAKAAVYGNRRRVRSRAGRALLARRGELIERSFAHLYDRGGMRRLHLRGRENILKRVLIHAAAFNLGLILRRLVGAGTPRQAAELPRRVLTGLFGPFFALLAAMEAVEKPLRPDGCCRVADCRWYRHRGS